MTRCCLDTRFHFEVARASTLNSIFFISPIFVRFNIPSLSFGKGAKRNRDLIKRGLQKYKIKCKKHFIFTQAQIVQRLDDAQPRSQGLPSSLLFEREVMYVTFTFEAKQNFQRMDSLLLAAVELSENEERFILRDTGHGKRLG